MTATARERKPERDSTGAAKMSGAGETPASIIKVEPARTNNTSRYNLAYFDALNETQVSLHAWITPYRAKLPLPAELYGADGESSRQRPVELGVGFHHVGAAQRSFVMLACSRAQARPMRGIGPQLLHGATQGR